MVYRPAHRTARPPSAQGKGPPPTPPKIMEKTSRETKYITHCVYRGSYYLVLRE